LVFAVAARLTPRAASYPSTRAILRAYGGSCALGISHRAAMPAE
jgi:hypothetical protein